MRVLLTAIHRGIPHTLYGGKVTAPHASVCWLSAGKPVVAAGVLRILEEKPDLWDHPISKTFPKLTGTPLGNLKLLSVLTHQTGLRFPNLDLSAPRNITLQTLAQTSSADCQLTPEQAAYDPRGGWWLCNSGSSITQVAHGETSSIKPFSNQVEQAGSFCRKKPQC